MRGWTAAMLGAAALGLTACGEPSKEDIMKDAEGVSSKADLRAALGDPDDIVAVGPLERWTYDASNGSVTFVITGDSVTLKAAAPKSGGDG